MAKEIQFCFQRYEKKYMLTPEQLPRLWEGMKSCMCPDEFGQYAVCNIYYDTEDFRLIRSSLEKPVYKEKLRLRSYGIPDDEERVFVELKKKYDGIVYKRRAAMTASLAAAFIKEGVAPERENQICREIDWFMNCYHPEPKVYIACDRIAFTGLESPDLRITFDSNLRWRDSGLDLRAGDYGDLLLPSGQILMEIKISGAVPVWLARLLSETGIFPVSFSKYGSWYVQHVLKQGESETVRKEVRICA